MGARRRRARVTDYLGFTKETETIPVQTLMKRSMVFATECQEHPPATERASSHFGTGPLKKVRRRS